VFIIIIIISSFGIYGAAVAGAAQRLQRWGVQITASEASRKIFLLYPQKGGTNIILRHPTGGTKSLQKLPVG